METSPSEFEEVVIQQVMTYESMVLLKRDASEQLRKSLLEAMRLLMPAESILTKNDRDKPWSIFRTLRGSDYGARSYEIVEVLNVEVGSPHVESTVWRANAWALNADGKRMNSKTYTNGMVWLEGSVLFDRWDLTGDAYRQAWRDSLMKIIAQADAIRAQAELEQALKGD